MSRKQRIYDAKFKAEVALEAIREQKGITEICAENNIPKTNVRDWKEKAEKGLHEIFKPNHEKEKEAKILKAEIEELHKLIGELTIENNYLKKKLNR